MAEYAEKGGESLLDEGEKAAQAFMDALNRLLGSARKLAGCIMRREKADRELVANTAEVMREADEVINRFGPFAQTVLNLADESFNIGFASAIKLAGRPDLLELAPEAEKAAVMLEARLILSEELEK